MKFAVNMSVIVVLRIVNQHTNLVDVGMQHQEQNRAFISLALVIRVTHKKRARRSFPQQSQSVQTGYRAGRMETNIFFWLKILPI